MPLDKTQPGIAELYADLVQASQIGTATGQIPVIPVLMAQMSTPVKSTIDAITAQGGPAWIATLIPPVNSDWNASTGLSKILNKPTLGTAAATAATDYQPAPKIIVRERRIVLPKFNVNLNTALADVAVWAGLPALWRFDELISFSPSVDLTATARIALSTTAGNVLGNIVASVAVSLGLGLITTYTVLGQAKVTANVGGSIYLNNTIAKGSVATASFQITITDLSP